MCAALQRDGYVDACATRDSDALIFGATCVYHTLNLQVSSLARPLLLSPGCEVLKAGTF